MNHKHEIANEKPFDEEKHKELLTTGIIKLDSRTFKKNTNKGIEENAIEISYMKSEFAKGFGTAVYRQVVNQSIKENLNGNVYVDADWKSHLFHLYMGMIPIDRVCAIGNDFIDGRLRRKIVDRLATEPSINLLQELFKEAPRNKGLFTQMVNLANERPHDTTISDEDLLTEDNIRRVVALRLKDKPLFYIKEQFIPQLFAKLKHESEEFGLVSMYLSDEGIARWKDAIERNVEFKPFKNLEHLHPYMTENEISYLNELLEARVVTAKAASITDQNKEHFIESAKQVALREELAQLRSTEKKSDDLVPPDDVVPKSPG